MQPTQKAARLISVVRRTRKIYESWKGMWHEFSNEVLSLFGAGEEIPTKELSER